MTRDMLVGFWAGLGAATLLHGNALGGIGLIVLACVFWIISREA